MQIRLFVLATSQDGEFTTTLHADETAARATLLDNFGDEIKDWSGEDDLTGMNDDDINDAICEVGIDWSIEEHLVDPAMFAQSTRLAARSSGWTTTETTSTPTIWSAGDRLLRAR